MFSNSFLEAGDARAFTQMWRDVLRRGSGWRTRLLRGKAALLKLAPELDVASLWKS